MCEGVVEPVDNGQGAGEVTGVVAGAAEGGGEVAGETPDGNGWAEGIMKAQDEWMEDEWMEDMGFQDFVEMELQGPTSSTSFSDVAYPPPLPLPGLKQQMLTSPRPVEAR